MWTLIVVLFVLWIFGFLGHVGGNLVHILLLIILIGFIYKIFFEGKRL